MYAARSPQSKPASIALSILNASSDNVGIQHDQEGRARAAKSCPSLMSRFHTILNWLI
jgi:hypothetical protein